ncbi:hypothetical protein BB561_001377 [Smittium simulii]|uniref:PX domain-containing protein n=1 Tax=Smittium simulii TaxID=133385 RepID=A0A2T9YUW5_9FUNG|nr:hypothetical protein BB561_001377 [Smittium simulii]
MKITGAHHCCNIERELYNALEKSSQEIETLQNKGIDYRKKVIYIKKTEKLVNNCSSYISYTIEFGPNTAKRRYSEFESFRKILTRMYPTFIIPIIPEKHSLAQYATERSKTKEDINIIKRRERMLGRFLGRIVEDPILSTNHIFHRFLEDGTSWSEIMHCPILSNLPNVARNSAELGSILNGLSLLEGADSEKLIDCTGQVIDISSSDLIILKSKLETGVLEYILEYTKFSQSINQVLNYRNSKYTQLENLNSKLEQKKNELKELLDVDVEILSTNDLDASEDNLNTRNSISPNTQNRKSNNFNHFSNQFKKDDMSNKYISTFSENSANNLSSVNDANSSIDLDKNRMIHNVVINTEFDPLAQFQLEQSMIWNDGIPSALPQDNYNILSNSQKRNDVNNLHDFGHKRDKNNDVSVLEESSLKSPDLHHQNVIENNNMHSEDCQNDFKSTSESLIASRSVPLGYTASSERTSSNNKYIGGSLLNKLSNSFNGIVDVNHDISRQLKISKLSENISEIETMTETINDDLVLIDESTQDSLNRFQKAKISDLKLMLLTMANTHIEFNNRCIIGWEKNLRSIKES